MNNFFRFTVYGELYTGYTIIAIAERGDLFTSAMSAKIIETAKEIIQEGHQLRGRLVGAHLGEADNVGEQNAEIYFKFLKYFL